MIGDLRPFIIAETAYNHEGDFCYLIRMVEDIARLRLDAVKFHLLLNPESYITKSHNLYAEYKKWLFSAKEWDKVINHAKRKGLDVVALCDDVESVRHIVKRHPRIFGLELHAVSLNDVFMLKEAALFPNKVILGVGGSTIDEIRYAVDFLRKRRKKDILLMYGFQNYPTDYSEINLSKALRLREFFGLPVGYADHTSYDDANNEVISCMAAMMGINILEKHYTPEPGKARIDFQSAVGRDAMQNIKALMALSLSIFGSSQAAMSEAELGYGKVGPMKKAMVARKDISRGEKVTLGKVWFKRTAEVSMLRQSQFLGLLGLSASRLIKKDDVISFDNVSCGKKTFSFTDHKKMFNEKKGKR